MPNAFRFAICCPFHWQFRHALIAHLINLFTMPGFWISNAQQRVHTGVIFRPIVIPSRDKGRNIRVHLYIPEGLDSSLPSPTVVHWHGSGFVMSAAFGTSREFCSFLAARTQCKVFDADYRKATQHPFPAAIHDAEDVLAYLLKYPDRHDSSNIFLSGFSSGGNIAFAMACSLGPKRIKGVTGIYAILDLTKVPERNAAPAKKKKGITAAGITVPAFIYDACFNTYVPPNHSRADSRISVALAPVSSFPGHVYLACGDTDSLFEPAVKLVQRLQEAGHNDAEFVSLQGMGHGFDMPGVRGEAEVMKEKAYTGVVDMIDRALIDGSLLGGW